MGSVQGKLTTWKIVLKQEIQAAEEGLVETVKTSGTVTPDELRGLLGIGDYRGLILDLGRALRLAPLVIAGCERAATYITALQVALKKLTARIWRYGGGHAAYVLVGLAEPIILLRRFFATIVCSRMWLKGGLWRRELLGRVALSLSNMAFQFIVNIAVAPAMVRTIHWFYRHILPFLAAFVRIFGLLLSVVFLSCKLFNALHGTIWTVFRLILAQTHSIAKLHAGCKNDVGTIVDLKLTLGMRVADSLLGRAVSGLAPRRNAEELWVDVAPDGPLFGSAEISGLMSLWQQIDTMSTIDSRAYEEILASFECPIYEVVAAVKRIVRPPRPLLSAVMVATGLRMGIGDRLAKLGHPHLARECSRWKFFGGGAGRHTSRRYVVVTPLNNYKHQKQRIISGKLIARMLETVLGDNSGSSFEFVFVLPVCHRGSVQALDRQKLKCLVCDTLAASHLPIGVKATLLDDLHTDITLPNIKGLQVIVGLQYLCSARAGEEVLVLSEMNDSASWLNIFHLAEALPQEEPALVTGRRPTLGAGKPVAGHAATRVFNCLFRFLIPNVTARDSSSVLKAMTVSSMRAIVNDLTCLDYSIDQDVLAMMAVRGRVIEKPIEWYQARGRWGHERPASAQLISLVDLARKARFKRRLATLRFTEWLPLDAGFDFKAMVNDRGEILKGHVHERNHLLLLLSALRSVTNRSTHHEEGHREYSRLVPLATHLISIVGQGPLKAVLRVAEGRYRDPLPSVREHLKYRVPAIVETTFVWKPTIHTPIGRSNPFLFALEQPFATLGTLRSAMVWNTRTGDVAGAADTLRVILSLQDSLLAHGVLDPDMKSLLDCGIFIKKGAVVAKHFDFAGFVRDPYVIAAVLPELMNKIESMRDFRQIARWLKKTPQGRTSVVNFRDELDSLTKAVPDRFASGIRMEFSTDAVPDPPRPPSATIRQVNDGLLDDVIATAKFANHSPIGTRQFQILMRHTAGDGSAELLAGQNAITITPSTFGMNVPEPLFVVSQQEVGERIDRAMAEFLPDRSYEIVRCPTPNALPLIRLLRDAADRGPGARVVMRLSGQSSRMRHLQDGDGFHKALIHVFGRPLLVHALEAMRIPASRYPDRVWLTHPDTVCVWGADTKIPNPEAEVVVPLAPEVFPLLRSYKYDGSTLRPKALEIGRLLARCRLALRTGGYSLPSLIGLDKATLRDLYDDGSWINHPDEADFWGHLSRALALPERYRRGQVATVMPQTWFDIDEPSQLMALYRHALVPGFTQYFGAATEPIGEDCVKIRSTIDTSSAGLGLRLRHCVFDNSNVIIDIDPTLTHASVEGLVVANSNARIRIAAPNVRDILISGITTAPDKAVALALDAQAIASSRNGVPMSVPLGLRAFSSDGHRNELLRCRVASIAAVVGLST